MKKLGRGSLLLSDLDRTHSRSFLVFGSLKESTFFDLPSLTPRDYHLPRLISGHLFILIQGTGVAAVRRGGG